jgi:predicted acyl esterase
VAADPQHTQEWPDLYEYTDDLRRFFDRYLALSDNGWEQTPPVRLAILDPGGTDTVDRPEEAFPPGRAQHRTLYLDASTGTLREDPPDEASSCRYAADDGEGHAAFVFRFEESTELVGYPKLRVWVEAVGSDDMDLFVLVQKLDSCGRLLRHEPHSGLGGAPLPIANFTGPRGRLRVSRRELDPVRSTPSRPFLALRSEKRLQPGEVVPVEIAISPVGLRWRAGEHVRVVVAGHDLSGPALPGLEPPPLRNRGYHVIHAGPGGDSHLLVPWSRAEP